MSLKKKDKTHFGLMKNWFLENGFRPFIFILFFNIKENSKYETWKEKTGLWKTESRFKSQVTY